MRALEINVIEYIFNKNAFLVFALQNYLKFNLFLLHSKKHKEKIRNITQNNEP